MKQELILESPIVKAITLAVLKTILERKISKRRVERINTDLIPKVSEKIIKSKMLGEGRIDTGVVGVRRGPVILPERRTAQIPQGYVMPPARYNVKIDTLLRNSMISLIECFGPDKPLGIVLRGMKQRTKIVLSKDEIKNFLEKIAGEARVPLIEGVFHAAVDDFVINSVVSDEIGSRFVLRRVGVSNI